MWVGIVIKFESSRGRLVIERDGAGTILRRYVHGPGNDEPLVWYEGAGLTSKRWLHTDERGSVIAVTDGSGASITTNRYDEYGIPQSGNTGRFQYTGQTWVPELGLYYYKARFYSPTLGRFMQTDPIGYMDGVNWYAYVDDDPINRTDPTGLCNRDVSAAFCDTIAKSPLAQQIVEPIKGPISPEQAKKIEDRVGFDPKGAGETRTAIQQGFQKSRTAWNVSNRADELARNVRDKDGKLLPGMSDGKQDGFRHALASAMLTRQIGPDGAKAFGDAHERFDENPRGERLMDLINNNNGRVLMQIFPGVDPVTLTKVAMATELLQTEPVSIEKSRR